MKKIDMTGKVVGRWLVIAPAANRGKNTRWLCRCTCGNERLVNLGSLQNNESQSCGCLRAELLVKSKFKHGESHNPLPSPEYSTWRSLITRCYDPKRENYKNYGGRGITVYPEWRESFAAFLTYVGRKPSPEHSINRINNNGNYEPGNVEWATPLDQSKNREYTIRLSIDGESKTISEWSKISGISHLTIYNRIKKGWEEKEAVFGNTQPGVGYKNRKAAGPC